VKSDIDTILRGVVWKRATMRNGPIVKVVRLTGVQTVTVPTLSATSPVYAQASPGDWIIRFDDETYAVAKPEVFNTTYDVTLS